MRREQVPSLGQRASQEVQVETLFQMVKVSKHAKTTLLGPLPLLKLTWAKEVQKMIKLIQGQLLCLESLGLRVS